MKMYSWLSLRMCFKSEGCQKMKGWLKDIVIPFFPPIIHSNNKSCKLLGKIFTFYKFTLCTENDPLTLRSMTNECANVLFCFLSFFFCRLSLGFGDKFVHISSPFKAHQSRRKIVNRKDKLLPFAFPLSSFQPPTLTWVMRGLFAFENDLGECRAVYVCHFFTWR